jgi:hypothetical protein
VRAAKDDGRGMEAQYKTAAVSEAVMKSAEVEESREVNSYLESRGNCTCLPLIGSCRGALILFLYPHHYQSLTH